MAEKERQRGDSPKPESASKPAKRAYEERERASESGRPAEETERGERNRGTFRNDRERASEAGRKGGQR